MARAALGTLLRYLGRLNDSSIPETADGDLLRRYAAGEEAAFAALLQRHAPLVWGVCRRLLGDDHDAEDAFQAAFLVLVRKAGSLHRPQSLAGFLHAVAYRVAHKARVTAARRRRHEARAEAPRHDDPLAAVEQRDLRALLDAELDHLPEKYRAPLVLCYLEGLSYAEAARRLGWRDGTVCGRLARAREMLRHRLGRRGLTLSTTVMTAALAETANAPAASLAAARRMAGLFALGQSVTDAVSTPAATLAQGLLHTMAAARLKMTLAAMLALGVLSAGASWAAHRVLAEKPAETDRKAEAKPAADKADTAKQIRKDYYGDPLPAGALVRMGSLQLRHEQARIAFSADGKMLISAAHPDRRVRFWDMATGREARQTAIRSGVSVAGLSSDGKLLAAFGEETLHVFETTKGKELRRLPAKGKGHQMAVFSADGKLLATLLGIADNYAIRLWDLSTGKERLALDHLSQAGDLMLSANGKWLAYHAADDRLHVWDTTEKREVCKGEVGGQDRTISPDGKTIAAANFKGTVTLWETAGLKKVATLQPSSAVSGRFIETPHLAFSADGKFLAVGGLEALVVWDVAARKEHRRLADHTAKEVRFSPDGKTLACVGRFEIRLWDVAAGKRLHDRSGHDTYVQSVAVSPDGKTVASIAGTDPVVRLWDAATGKPREWFPKHNSWVRTLVFASDGRLLVAGGFGVLRLLGADGAELRRFVVKDHKSGRQNHEVLVAHLSADDKRLSAISVGLGQNGHQLTTWDVRTGERLACRPFRGEMDSSFSADGERVTVSRRERLILEDTRTGREQGSIPGDLGRPVAFSPDGALLAVGIHKTVNDPFGGSGGYQPLGVRVVEIASGQEIFHVEGWIDFAAFSPDGRTLVTADTKALRLWDVATGERLLSRTWPEDSVRHPTMTTIYSLAFLPNGRALVTGQNDGILLVWDLMPESPPKALARHLDRKELDVLWADLAGEARKAHRALHALAAAPDDALPMLAERLRPVAVVDAKKVEKLLADLDSEQFAVRDAAAKELIRMGTQIEPALWRVLENKPSLEVRNRIQAIQASLHGVPPAPTLRSLRAIRALEQIGTTEARQILSKLAEGAAEARPTRAAKKALDRLTSRASRGR